jgi:hypothetical protein
MALWEIHALLRDAKAVGPLITLTTMGVAVASSVALSACCVLLTHTHPRSALAEPQTNKLLW